MTKKQTSLKDVAKALNVSVSTVSRALKNHPDISVALREKIKQLAAQMKYHPNPLAMGLLRRQTRTIGVIVPDMVTHFFSSVVSGIEDVASKNGYYVVITTSNESYEKEKSCVENLLLLRVEGIIACLSRETADFTHFTPVKETGIPLVFFDRVCRTSEFSSVVADNFEASKNITQYLYNSGARRIAHITGPEYLNICRERKSGYLEGLRMCGVTVEPDLLVQSEMDIETGTRAAQKLLSLKKVPDAILGVNDMVVYATMKELKQNKIKIPNDIAVVGFTDDFHANFMEPSLTSVTHPTFEMGQEAASLLIDQAKAETELPIKQVIIKTKMIIRESTIKI